MRRLVSSSKFWVAVAAAVGATLAALNVPTERATAIVTAITSLGAVVVLAIAWEDGAEKGAGEKKTP